MVCASAIGCFPDLLVQNEKNAGRYRMLLSQRRLPAVAGIARSAGDRRRAAAIEALLCQGSTDVGEFVSEIASGLEPFIERGLAALDGGRLTLASAAVPYARSIAALLDPYRQHSATRFSSAV